MRKGGNPDLVEHQYKCLIDDRPMEVLSIRIPQGTKEKLIQKFGKNYTDKIREMIGGVEELAEGMSARLQQERINQLEEENKELREDCDRLTSELEKLPRSPKVGVAPLPQSNSQLEQAMNKYLMSLKVGKQSLEYKRTLKILAEFIDMLRKDFN